MANIVQEKNLSHLFTEGVYAGLGGPTYETPAECRLLKLVGVDVVGMSTVPEVLIARHCGMKVFAVSLVTNKAQFDVDIAATTNHDEVLETASKRAKLLQELICELIKHI